VLPELAAIELRLIGSSPPTCHGLEVGPVITRESAVGSIGAVNTFKLVASWRVTRQVLTRFAQAVNVRCVVDRGHVTAHALLRAVLLCDCAFTASLAEGQALRRKFTRRAEITAKLALASLELARRAVLAGGR
jgi:hypothetical protein